MAHTSAADAKAHKAVAKVDIQPPHLTLATKGATTEASHGPAAHQEPKISRRL